MHRKLQAVLSRGFAGLYTSLLRTVQVSLHTVLACQRTKVNVERNVGFRESAESISSETSSGTCCRRRSGMVRGGQLYFLLGQLAPLDRYTMGLHHRQCLWGGDKSIVNKMVRWWWSR